MKRLLAAVRSFRPGLKGFCLILLLIFAFAAIRLLDGYGPFEGRLKATGLFALAALAGFGIGYAATEASGATIQNRRLAYTFCVLAVFTSSALGVSFVTGSWIDERGESHEAKMSLKERDDWIEITFLAMIIPALIGTRSGLRANEPFVPAEEDTYEKFVEKRRKAQEGEEV